jgi:Tfp pilus assembly protein PilN
MIDKIPNLARKPFLNTRPVVRVAILLGVLGLALAGANLYAYWSFSQGQDVKRDLLEETRVAIQDEQERLQSLDERRQHVDLESQNEQVVFLNRKIRQRTFGWSLLFDTLTEILPRDVRIGRLSLESIGEDDAGRRSRRGGSGSELRPGEIQLGIEGEARNYDAFLDFLDALFQSSAFREANPAGDSKIQTGMFRFRLSVLYLPGEAAALERRQREATEQETTKAAGSSPDDEDGVGTTAETDGAHETDGAATGASPGEETS